jgi:hypothetical protein
MSTETDQKSQDLGQPAQQGIFAGNRSKAIVVRVVKVPPWAKIALDRSIDSAMERYKKIGK